MANTKEYFIKINGLQQSIDAVESLNKQLDKLEQKMKTLSSSKVGGGGSTKANAALSEEEQVQKEINKLKQQGQQLDAKILAAQDEIYKRVDATKQLYKETIADQKALAAAERLQADAYSNTMVGMKQQLADIKAVIQTTDLGDGDAIKKMTQQANELNEKLKKVEESYGQFGRNVGNYKSAFDGMQKLSVTVGGVTREFNSAREASKTLKNELIGLEAAGSGNTEVAKELRSEYYKLQSAMDDATKSSKAMDEAMDAMKSFTALASIGNGLQAFFGFDNNEITKSIQKLVALQGVLQGIETITKQMETEEGIGKIFSDGSKAVDTFVANITGAKIGMDGLTMSSRAATIAVKGLSLALKAIGIGLVTAAIAYAVDGLQKFVKSLDTTKTKINSLESSVKALNRQYEQRKDLLAGSYLNNALSTEQFLAEQYRLENEYLDKQISLLQQRQEIANKPGLMNDFFTPTGEYNGFTGKKFSGSASSSSWYFGQSFSYDVSSIKEAEEAWRKLNKAVSEGKDYFSEYGEGLSGWWDSLFTTVTQTEDVMKGMGNIVLSNVVGEFQELEKKFSSGKISAEEYAKGLKELTDAMNSSDVLNSVIANLDQYIPDEEVRKKVENIIQYLYRLNDEFNAVSEAQVHRWNQVRIDAMEEGAAKIAAQMAEDERHEIAQYAKTQEQVELIQKKYQRKRLDETKKQNEKIARERKKNAKEQLEAERELSNLRIANMKEGLNKVLKQLEEERKLRIAKVVADGRLVEERRAEINKLYRKKELEAQRDWAEKVEKAYRDLYDNIRNYSLDTTRIIVNSLQQAYDIGKQNWDYSKEEKYGGGWSRIPDYGVQGQNQLSRETQTELGIENEMTKRLATVYAERSRIIRDYWKQREEFETSALDSIYQMQVALENENYEAERINVEHHYNDLVNDLEKKEREGLITYEKFLELRQQALDEHNMRVKVMQVQHENTIKQLEQESFNKRREIFTESLRQRLQELRDYQTAISNLEAKQPVYTSWGFIDFKKTNENNRNLLEAYRKLVNDIAKLKEELQEKLDAHEITFDDFQNANRELDAFVDNVGQKMDEVKYKLSDAGQFQTFVQNVQQFAQQLGSALNSMLQAFGDYTDQQYENTINDLEEQIDKLQDLYDRQEEIVNEHKSKLDSIEDELATARGDRRQHLIDQLNAEMEAQRAAFAEQKKIEKEKKALEDKKDQEEMARKKAQKKIAMTSAVINGATAFMNALSQQPIWLGIALAAMTAAMTAVQIATISSAKYADGGVIQGKSHAQGGVKVLGGQAEVEGQEFITNRQTTSKNVDLLYYINSKKKKLDLSDFIEFYSSGNMTKNISPTKRIFADGGQIPTLRNDIDINDRLLAAFEDYSNRNVVVSVVDINNRQEAVRKVQVLSGLNADD